ncbi:MAG: hypothetical protein AAFX80_15350 [Cyanobacteria bacterium J06639_18]
MFGLFKKKDSQFPKVKLGNDLCKFEVKGFAQQNVVKLQWDGPSETFPHFVIHYLETRLDYCGTLHETAAALRNEVINFLDNPTAPV